MATGFFICSICVHGEHNHDLFTPRQHGKTVKGFDIEFKITMWDDDKTVSYLIYSMYGAI